MTVLLQYELEDPAGRRVPFLPADDHIIDPAAFEMLRVPASTAVFDLPPQAVFRIRRRALYSRHLLLCSGDVVARVWRFHCVFHRGAAGYDCQAPWDAPPDAWRLRKHLVREIRAYERARGREPDAWVAPLSVHRGERRHVPTWRLPFRLREGADGRLVIRPPGPRRWCSSDCGRRSSGRRFF